MIRTLALNLNQKELVTNSKIKRSYTVLRNFVAIFLCCWTTSCNDMQVYVVLHRNSQ